MEILVSDNKYDWNGNNDILNNENKSETVNDLMISNDLGEKEVHICNFDLIKDKCEFNLINKFNIFSFFTPKIRTGHLFLNKKRKRKMFSTRKKNRKEMSDNLLKKIKSKFFKCLRQSLINRLKKDKKNFRLSFKFSQKFIRDVTKINNNYWDETLFDFASKNLEGNNKDFVIEYLTNDKIGNIILRDIYNEYLLSQEFEDGIPNENEGQNYINKYMNKAKDFINYYANNRNNININNKNSEANLNQEYVQLFIPNYNFNPLNFINDSYDGCINSLSNPSKLESNSDILKNLNKNY